MSKIIFGVVILSLIGLYLRFYNIEHIFPYGWDQARDAYQVKDILEGKFTLEGPRTGVGHFHLGPLWFYLLAPFFFFTNLDPIASQYLNIFICIVTFGTIFYITKKLFSTPFAFLALGMYALNSYLINLNRIPWNVSLMPVLSILIFYFTYKTFQEKKFKWVVAIMTSFGIAFHTHFSAIIFPPMLLLLWLINNERGKMLLLFLKGLPFYLVWFLPNVVAHFMTSYADYYRMQEFLKYWFVGVHLRFILHTLPDTLMQFRILLSLPLFVGFLILLSNFFFYFKGRKINKLYIKIFIAWLIPFIGIFGVYGGQISEYYFIFLLPVVYYSFFVLIQQLFKLRYKIIGILILLSFIGYYSYQNVKTYPSNSGSYGLVGQKEAVKQLIKSGKKIKYEEGKIESYLYSIMNR